MTWEASSENLTNNKCKYKNILGKKNVYTGYFLSVEVNFKQVPEKHKASYANVLVHKVS